ncbi:MAG TPA: preprotein translocase subunit SecY [Candidatus Atopostipes pullistercoris]|uniref:Protein translocase subunit SecY n=1 Tax=Candidatus Atopostipes pullistercoris TaxID=2838467 RepID=A0A9D2G2P7_9LACT|nr:preprotein translocase subunit SecY [Candidatus Atopostipes pullistercoris]
MIGLLKGAFTEENIRKRLFFTLGIILVFRFGTYITVPGVNATAIQELNDSGLFNLLDTFGGGALQNYSIFALGISPYITSSIVIELLQMDIIPKFKEWSEQGEVGRRKLNQATRYLAIFVAFFQALGISLGFNTLASLDLIVNPGLATYLKIAIIMTAGTMFVMWLGEMITVHGIGNGTSLIIFSGIVSRIPSDLYEIYNTQIRNAGDEIVQSSLLVLGFFIGFIILILFVIYMENARRNIPIRYSKRAVSSEEAVLPLKVNSAGVIPVIFASSFMMVPQIILGLFATGNQSNRWFQIISSIFNMQEPVGAILYVTLIVLFTYFYAFIQVNPEKATENLQRQNAYIPSVRPGRETEKYISYVLVRLSTIGAIYLAIIAILPIMVSAIWNIPTLALGGTSLLIVVGVGLDFTSQIEGLLSKTSYTGFINEYKPEYSQETR